jgi:hypothetical protein
MAFDEGDDHNEQSDNQSNKDYHESDEYWQLIIIT